ncbi:MAG: MlaD family protein [Sulfitobacter sp.]|nr:MlaD family protein [Sulfitobacter sp.]
MTDDLPNVSVSPARKAFFSGASLVWLLPILALGVALWVAWSTYNDQGPLIQVEFEAGAGIAAGETELRYRDVTVGVVEEVGFTEGLAKVVATIRVDADVARFIDNTAVFWIVEPEVTAQGITGLSTVLSGVYIEGSWDDEAGIFQYNFQGATAPPLIRPGQAGLEIAFRTTGQGTLTDNAPILYRGIEVGRVGRAKINPQDNTAIAEALIFEEHRGLINDSTRFWDTSGFTVSIGPAGAEIDFSSLATLVGGGITFDTFVSGGNPASDGAVFEIFADKETARNSVFNASEVDPLKLSVIFNENISGLAVGAAVELSGLRIGEVETISGVIDYNQFGDSRVRLRANLSIQPSRLGLPDEVTAEAALDFLRERVGNGLRARLASASLLTGGLKVELVTVDDAAPAQIGTGDNGLPLLPTTQNEMTDTAATVEGVFTRINGLPIEELLNSAISFLNSAESLVADENLRETPQDVRLLLAEISGLVASEDVQNIPTALNATLTRIEGLVAELEEQRLAEKLIAAIDTVSTTAEGFETTVAGVPGLIEDLSAVAQKADALEIEELVAEVTALIDSAQALVASEATQAIPAGVQQAIDQVNLTLDELRAGGLVPNLNQTLASARIAAGNVAETTQRLPDLTTRLRTVLDNAASTTATIDTAVAGVPELIEQIQRVAAKAEALPVEDLVAEVTDLLDTAQALVASEATQAIPAGVQQAIDQVNLTLEELRAGGLVPNLNQTVASARIAAGNVADTTQELPELTARLRAVLDDAASATANIDSAVAGVPALVEQFQRVATKAENLPVEELIQELTELSATADTLIGSEDTAAVPAALKGALDEVNFALQQLREGGVIENVNRTLVSARNAADTVAVSVADLPQIVTRLNDLFAQAGRTIEGYNRGEELSRAAQQTLREIQQAADALASLARTIERNPNSLLLGR